MFSEVFRLTIIFRMLYFLQFLGVVRLLHVRDALVSTPQSFRVSHMRTRENQIGNNDAQGMVACASKYQHDGKPKEGQECTQNSTVPYTS